jgi:hypothetical protein
MSQSEGRALFVVTIEIDPAHEDEFNRWYDEEHFPERVGCPGFLTARRFRSADGAPKFLAIYDLESPAALETPEYRALSEPSEWTKRIRTFYRSFVRDVYIDITPPSGKRPA